MPTPLDFHTILSSFISGDLSTPQNSIWLVYASVIISTVSTPNYISSLWKYISTCVPSEDKQLVIARRLREGLLKNSPLAGLPRGINSLSALRSALNEFSPSISKTYESDPSLRTPLSPTELSTRGQTFFNRIYGKVSQRIEQNMSLSSGGDLSLFVIRDIYGELMAEESILDAKETALLEFVACFVSGAVPQAKGHLHGCRNLGNGRMEIGKAVKLVRELAGALGVQLDEEGMRFVEGVGEWDV